MGCTAFTLVSHFSEQTSTATVAASGFRDKFLETFVEISTYNFIIFQQYVIESASSQ